MIYLVRHGETNWNKKGLVQGVQDIPLNINGIYQAKNKAKLFKDHHITHVITSPLKRASKTAEILTSSAEVDNFEIDERLIEYDFGSNDGRVIGTEASDVNDEEDVGAFQQRIFASLLDAAQLEGNVVMISHGAVIATLIRMLLPEELRDQWFGLENCSVVGIEPEFLEDNKLAINLVGINMEDDDVEELLKKYD